MEIGNGMVREDEQAAPAGPGSTMRQRNDARPRVQGLCFSETLTGKLRERAREERTTVHAALLAALGIAGRRASAAWRDIPIRLSSTVNARGELGLGDDCGVFVGAASSTLDPECTNSVLLVSGALRAARSRALPLVRLERELLRLCWLCARQSAIAPTSLRLPRSPRRPSPARRCSPISVRSRSPVNSVH